MLQRVLKSSGLVAATRQASTARRLVSRTNRTIYARWYSSGEVSFDAMAKSMEDKLKAQLKDVQHVSIQDARGDGSFLHIHVVAAEFEGKTPLKQHQLVNTVLKEEIAKVHGVTLKTQTPAAFARLNQ